MKSRLVDGLRLALLLALSACTHHRSGAAPEPAAPSQTGSAGKYGQVPSEDLLGGKGAAAFALVGPAADTVEQSTVAVTGQPFAQASRFKVKERARNSWEVQWRAPATADIHTGDVLLASFYLRTEFVPVESGEGQTEINVELAKPPHDKAATYAASAGPEWKQIFVPFRAKQDFPASSSQMAFRLGFQQQTLDIAEVKLENFGNKLALSDLPKTKTLYPGMEPDAPWRAAAAARIDQLRRSDLTVKVTAGGKPVPAANVHAVLEQHAFLFGTCAPAATLLDASQTQFQGLLLENFNTVTLENDLKWEPLAGAWEPEYTLTRANAGLDWVRSHGLRARGHVLVWPGWNELPPFMKEHQGDKARLRAEVAKHIKEVMTAVKGKVVHWDVVNEPFTNHDLLDILGPEVMVEWFKLARQADPKPKLYINDFGILPGGGGSTEHRDHYEKMIQILADGGAPFDGIGMQGHFGASLTGPEDLMKVLDRYGKFGKDIAVTEFDVVLDDEDVAGAYARDFYTTLFSHPRVAMVMMWGFWDSNHWKKNAVMYHPDWSLKPGGKAYRDLVLGEWRTDVAGATDTTGTFKTRGFLGRYAIEVTLGGKTERVKGELAAGGSEVVVKL
jgi:endo-1,4-beta-xylanase